MSKKRKMADLVEPCQVPGEVPRDHERSIKDFPEWSVLHSGSLKPGSFWTKRRLQAFVNLLVGLVGEKGDRKPKHKHKSDMIYAMHDTMPAPYQLARAGRFHIAWARVGLDSIAW
jgi:hypothetical protein